VIIERPSTYESQHGDLRVTRARCARGFTREEQASVRAPACFPRTYRGLGDTVKSRLVRYYKSP
jgi:hypothetical protein